MVGKDHLWPIDDTWNYHAEAAHSKTCMSSPTLECALRPATSAEDYAVKAQLQTYEAFAPCTRLQRNKYTSTGVISGC